MQAGTLALDPSKATKFTGSDGRLEIDVPAGAVTPADDAAAGGQIRLKIQQVGPASGSTAGGSGIVSLGTYLLQVTDSAGQLTPNGLRAPVTATLHYDPRDRAFDLRHAILALNLTPAAGTNLNPISGGSALSAVAAGLGAPTTQPLTLNPDQQTLSAAAPASSPSTSLSFNTNSPVASFGKPDPFNSDLSAGSLTAGFPIDVPRGAGGLTPSLQLGYSSAAVAEQHNPQAAAPWVGEGWNLSMGSISWAEHNVAESAPPANYEDSWLLNDSFGTSTELIPPNTTVATYNQDSPNGITASPVAWHTSSENHSRVYSYTRTATLASAPKAVSWGSGRIDVFAHGSDNALWHIWYDSSAGGWGIWENLGGNIGSAPEVTTWGVGRLDVFAKAQDGSLSHIYFDSSHGGWSSWSSLGTPSNVQLASDPGAVSWGSGRIDVFEQGSDNALWHIFYDSSAGGWNPWSQTSNAITLASGADVSSWGVGRLDVFARGGTGNPLQHIYYSSASGWSSWSSLGTPPTLQLQADPGAVSWGSGRIDVFAEGSDQALWHIDYDQSSGGWSGWSSNGGTLTASPDVASWGVGRLDVFSRDTSNALSHIFYDSSAGGWNPWSSQGVPTLPCFRAFLPNGIMEEFGCTPDSLQYYPVPVGSRVGTEFIANWLVDLITDSQGNQIHATYSQDMEQGYAGKAYPRDAVMATVEYDSPSCHNAQAACMGSAWAPLMRVSFSSGHAVQSLTGPSCPVNGVLRCDDPIDLSGTNGFANPTVQSTLVLNEIDVQVRASSSAGWNTLRKYQLSYEQTPPTTVVDPATGSNESTAGKLNLTQLLETGADGSTSLPARTFSYSTQTEYYEDSAYHPTPSSNCGPTWNTGTGSGCLLWSQSYAGNSSYLAGASNGLGLSQTFSWANARSNTHGANAGGGPADPLACSTQSTYPCNAADDQNWSHVAMTQESGTVIRQTIAGGVQSNTPITSTTSYSYSLQYPLVARACGDCVAGFTWGDQKDGDYSDFYNAKFMGFALATVTKPDGAFEVHKFHSTLGWGVYDCTQVSLGCTADAGQAPRTYCYSACHSDPWWPLSGQSVVNALHGQEYELDVFTNSNQATLLRKTTTTYPSVLAGACPPQGVSASPPNGDGSWDSQLVSELDPSNPVAACDLQVSQRDDFVVDGSTNPNVPHRTTTYSYDQYGRVTSETGSSNDGSGTASATAIVTKTAYVWNDAVSATSTGATGTYLIDFPSLLSTEDTAGNRFACTYTSYDGQPNTSGQTGGLTTGAVTQVDRFANCGTLAQNFTDRSGPLTTAHTYDAYGNLITTSDPDANAGIGSHKGCNIGGMAYSDCLAYDSTFLALPTSQSNALNQTTITGYQAPSSGTAAGGFGLWPISTTDPNNQTTSYTYDPLGQLTSQTLPNETAGLTTTSDTYTVWCAGTSAQAPCVEIDNTQRLNSSTTVASRSFYDGWGHLIETRTPATNNQDVVRYSNYDQSGRMTFQSVAYFVTAYTGSPGAAAYAIPDSSRAGAPFTYDGLGRTLTSKDPLNNQTSNAFSVVCGTIPGDSACYEQTLTVDPLGHQGGGLVDAFGRRQYVQAYSGNSPATYAVYATTKYTYDFNGKLTQILEPNGSSKITYQFDAAGRQTGLTDPDLGSSTYAYDQDGNLTQSVDARGAAGTIYVAYDGLDRPLWHNATNSPTNAYETFTYDSTANGNQGIGRLTSETFSSLSGNLSGTWSYSYDGRGQQSNATLNIGAQAYGVTTGYDDAGHVTREQYPGTGETVTTNYSQGWLTGVSTSAGPTTLLANGSYADPSGGPTGQLSGADLGTGATYHFSASFDALARTTDRKWTHSGSTVFEQSRSFDAAGNVTAANSTLPAGTDNQVFCYDEQNRLTWAGASGTPPCGSLTPGTLTAAQYQQAFTYDNLGRLTSVGGAAYSYGDPAHLHATTAIGATYSASYDIAGNLGCRAPTASTTCAGTPTGAQLTYDREGRLAAWQSSPTNPSSTATYLYDNQGNRVAQQATSNGTTTTTIYVGNLEEIATTGSTTTTTTYYYAGGLRITEAVNGTVSYLATDALGSADVALNAGGSASASVLYFPYGGVRYSSGTMPTDYGFTGQHAEGLSGLDYYNARYYDPAVGQFTSADAMLQGGGFDVFGLSRYAYVEGDPVDRTDPSGNHQTLGCEPNCTNVDYAAFRAEQTCAFGGSSACGYAIYQEFSARYFLARAQLSSRAATTRLIRVLRMQAGFSVPGDTLDELTVAYFDSTRIGPHAQKLLDETRNGLAEAAAERTMSSEAEAGVFHRLESPTQTPEVAATQQGSGEIWGRAPRGQVIPKVQAYRGPLPEGARGIEFTTDVPPDPSGHPYHAEWSGPRPGVRVEYDVDLFGNWDEFAKIEVEMLNNTQI